MRRSVQDIFIRGGCASGLSCVVPRARRERRRKWLKGDGPAAGPSLRRRRARPTPPSWAARRRRPARRPERGSREPPARAGGVQPCPVSTGGWTRRVRLVRGWTRHVKLVRGDGRGVSGQHGEMRLQERGRGSRGSGGRRATSTAGASSSGAGGARGERPSVASSDATAVAICRARPTVSRQPSAVSRQPSAALGGPLRGGRRASARATCWQGLVVVVGGQVAGES